MYYVRNSSNTLLNAISQNRSQSQFNQKTTKNLSINKKSKLHDKRENDPKPYFSNLDVDIKKISNGGSMEKNFARNYNKANNFLTKMTKIDGHSEELKNDNNWMKTAKNFSKSNEGLALINDNNDSKIAPHNLYLINDQIPQRNIHSSQGFSIKQETIDYERKLKTSHDNRGENMRKSRELKNKNYESDPFFIKKYDFADEKYNIQRETSLKSSKPNYYESNVFFSKDKSKVNDMISQKNSQFYGITNTSKSEWCPKNSKTNLLNHTSVPFSIFNANTKSFIKTKEEIFQENNGNPAHKQKSLCEFIDLTRVFCPNPNKDFLKAFQKSTSAFHKKSKIE